ncbi:MAG: FeoC-like transcriptional regulator [Candidatus Cloacimonetes bacterium]|nr:FeoC-like transcriptional regulator [Candidatus Cloacimonadota bacterium]
MLREIKKLFQERRTISLSDLAIYFKIQESALDGILEKLVKKKFIEHINTECFACSSSCSSCSFASKEILYRIVKSGTIN